MKAVRAACARAQAATVGTGTSDRAAGLVTLAAIAVLGLFALVAVARRRGPGRRRAPPVRARARGVARLPLLRGERRGQRALSLAAHPIGRSGTASRAPPPRSACCSRAHARHRHALGPVTWGVYWTWDARLTTTALLFVLFLGYLALRRMPAAVDVRAKRSAIVGLLAFIDVPIVHCSVDWWQGAAPAGDDPRRLCTRRSQASWCSPVARVRLRAGRSPGCSMHRFRVAGAGGRAGSAVARPGYRGPSAPRARFPRPARPPDDRRRLHRRRLGRGRRAGSAYALHESCGAAGALSRELPDEDKPWT